jgi:hypothetical protein
MVEASNVWGEVIDFLLTQPTPEQVIAFQSSEQMQERVRYLLDVNRNGTLTPAEKQEMDEIARVGHFVALLKIRAREKLVEAITQL